MKKIIKKFISITTNNIIGVYSSDVFKTHASNLHPHLVTHFNNLQNKDFDLTEESITWLPLSLIDFLAERLKKEFNIFEYGSGSSSIFFAKKCNQVNTVEYNRSWFNKVLDAKKKFNLNNLYIRYNNLEDGYVTVY